MLPSNLGSYMRNNLQDMVTGAREMNLSPDVNFVVYYNPDNDTPYLFRITKNGIDTVKTYENHNGATPEMLSSVIKEVKQKYPASSYGLLMSSHGTGWLGQGQFVKSYLRSYLREDDRPITKTIGTDRDNGVSEEIEIWEMAQAIPDNSFDFILFDACYMMTVETAYELRNKCGYIVGSVAETPAQGMPYDLIMKDLLATETDLKGLCKKFYEFYNAKTGWERTGLTTLLKTSELNMLAMLVQLAMEKYTGDINNLYIGDIQRFDLKHIESTYFQYDFEHYMEKLCSDPLILFAIKEHLKNVIVVKYETPKILDQGLVKRHCGLSCFVPKSSNIHYEANTKTEWYKKIMGKIN